MAARGELLGAPQLPALDLDAKPREGGVGGRSTADRCSSTSFAIILLALLPLAAAAHAQPVPEVGRPDHDDRCADLAGRPGHVRVRGRDVRRLPRAAPRRHDEGARARTIRAARRAGSSIPADPDAGVITWQGSWRSLEQPWEFAPQWGNFAEVWTRINFPRLMFNTIALARDRRHRHDRVVHAGCLRLRPLPVPRPRLPLPAAAVDDLPAGGGHADPDLHDLRQAGMGRHLAAVAHSGLLRERV